MAPTKGEPRANERRPVAMRVLLLATIAGLAVLSLSASFERISSPRVSRLSTSSHAQGPPHGLRSESDASSTRKLAVREAMQYAWTKYHTHAFGADEIAPLDGTPRNSWGNIGCMILDSMDTLWIMDLKDEFEQAREWVHTELSFDNMGEVSVFETIIRSVGGLLSAYDLSGDRVLLDKARELTDRLLPAIDTSTGRANYYLNTLTNESYHPGGLAESGTYQLEFEYLSRATGDPKYADIAQKLYPYLRAQPSIQRDGLFANEIFVLDKGATPGQLTLKLGCGADSFYEYLLKVWIFDGQPEPSQKKDMFLAAVDGMEKLLLSTSASGRTILGDYNLATGTSLWRMEHLACFVPGWLTLGAHRLQGEDPERSKHYVDIAKRLMETCYKDLYEKQPSKLSPEFVDGQDLRAPGAGSWAATYLLRPEVVESLYVLYQLTGDSIYQEWGWEIFQAVDRNCRTEFGFAQYKDVSTKVEWSSDPETRKSQQQRALDNSMQTFFTAETLKYLYLLFDEHNAHVNLETHVFNTEAHPLSIAAS